MSLASQHTLVDGRVVRYRHLDAGDGLPLLLIHGIACSSAAFGPLLAELAARPDRRPALAADMPGYGRSPGPARALDMEELAAWHCALLDVLGVARVHLVGHSMGCQVALALARQAPWRVASAVLVGPTTGAEEASLLRYGLGLVADSFVESWAWNWTLARMSAQMGPRRYLATLPHMLRDRPIALAEAVRCPVLVVRGGRDRIIPRRASLRLAAALPGGCHVELPGPAHAAQFDRPAALCDAMAPLLADAELPTRLTVATAEPTKVVAGDASLGLRGRKP